MARLLPLPIIILALYLGAYCPIQSQLHHFRYKMALAYGNVEEAEREILKALSYDPENTVYLFSASILFNIKGNVGKSMDYLEKSINHYNGDIVRWTQYYLKGVLKLKEGASWEANDAFQKALYYNPKFGEARRMLTELEKTLREGR